MCKYVWLACCAAEYTAGSMQKYGLLVCCVAKVYSGGMRKMVGGLVVQPKPVHSQSDRGLPLHAQGARY